MVICMLLGRIAEAAVVVWTFSMANHEWGVMISLGDTAIPIFPRALLNGSLCGMGVWRLFEPCHFYSELTFKWDRPKVGLLWIVGNFLRSVFCPEKNFPSQATNSHYHPGIKISYRIRATPSKLVNSCLCHKWVWKFRWNQQPECGIHLGRKLKHSWPAGNARK